MSGSYGTIDSASWTDYATALEHTQEKAGQRVIGTTNVPVFTSCRWMVAYVCFAGSVVVLALQQDLSMSLVCMFPREDDSLNNTAISWTEIITNDTEPKSESLDWSEQTQGLLLSANFYGALVSPIIAGYLSTRYGGKLVLVVSTMVAVLGTVFTPAAAWVSPWLVFFLRVLLGLSSGAYNPAVQALLTNWAPVYDRAKMIAFCFSGANLGNVISYAIPGLVCTLPFAGGWPLIFYIFSALATVWIVWVLFCIYNSPDTHPRIKEIERHYIASGMPRSTVKEDHKLPLRYMVTSVPLWVCIVCQFINTYCQLVQQLNSPMYMRDVLRFSIEENGLLSTLPAFGRLVGALVSGYISDILIKKRLLSVTATRKVLFSFGFLVPTASLFGVAYMGRDQREYAVLLLVVTGTTSAAGMISIRVNLIDIAPRYSSILLGVLMTVSGIVGVIAPVSVTMIAPEGTQEQWQIVFIICAGLYGFGTLVFVVFGSSDEQWWSYGSEETLLILGKQARGHGFRNGYLVTNKLTLPNTDSGRPRNNTTGKGQTFLDSGVY